MEKDYMTYKQFYLFLASIGGGIALSTISSTAGLIVGMIFALISIYGSYRLEEKKK